MKLSRTIAIAATLLMLTAPVWAESSLTPHTAQYKVKISVLSGRLNTQLLATDEGYVARHVIKPTGLSRLLARGKMDVTSEFESACGGIRPVSYKSKDTIRKDPDVDLQFDWSTNQATGLIGDEAVTLQLDGVSHDSVSLQYELMHDLMNGGPSKHYTIFDTEKMRIANIENVGNKRIKTKAGIFDTVGIRHQREGSSRVTTFWTAKELGYLPVVMEQHRKGKLKFRASLEKYTPIVQ